ncbi:MAG TPA: DUF488 domain-containing protein [Acidimicrobiales bacterium]|nr:DUF488 domain-containing protein [Acidimicrobiales bacterium]
MTHADVELLTIGHGTLGQADLTSLLHVGEVGLLVDVRTAPGSRRHPHVARAALEQWLPEAGIAYEWEPRLGGWRKADPASPNLALRNESFRGYADYMRSEAFWAALDEVLALAAGRRTAVMCSESVYWRCHRRLIADAAVIGRGARVSHLGHDGRLSSHELTDGARAENGQPVYDLGAPERFPGISSQ